MTWLRADQAVSQVTSGLSAFAATPSAESFAAA